MNPEVSNNGSENGFMEPPHIAMPAMRFVSVIKNTDTLTSSENMTVDAMLK